VAGDLYTISLLYFLAQVKVEVQVKKKIETSEFLYSIFFLLHSVSFSSQKFVLNFTHSNFKFISDFVLRILDLRLLNIKNGISFDGITGSRVDGFQPAFFDSAGMVVVAADVVVYLRVVQEHLT